MIPEIDVETLADLHPQGVTIIDVRNPHEYDSAHVPGAVLITMAEIADRADEVPTGETVYLICATGARSQRAGEFLAAQGRDVVNVAGGTKAWIDAGHDINEGMDP